MSRLAFLATAVSLFPSCKSSSGGPTDPDPAFAITLSASSVTMAPGAQTTVTVAVARAGGFNGDLAITVSGLPLGVTVNALTISGGSTSGVLEFSAVAGAATGTTTLTITGTGDGVVARTAGLNLTISVPDTPDFSLSPSSPSAAVAAGGTTQIEVTLNRIGGFSGPVSLSATGLPDGVTSSFDPGTIATGSTKSILTLTAAPSAALTSGTVTVQGLGSVGQRSTSLAVQLTSPGSNISYTFCGLTGVPIWMAVKNENGPWSAVPGSSGTFDFSIPGSRGAVAWVIEPAPGRYNLNVLYASRDQIVSYGSELCKGMEGTGKTVHASVAGMQTADVAVVSLGGVLPVIPPSSFVGNISFTGVPEGPVDLIAGVTELTSFTPPVVMTPKRFVIRRGLNPPANGALAPIDFNGAEAFAPVQNSLVVNGAGAGEIVLALTGFRTANGFAGSIGQAAGLNSWFGVPADRLAAGDLHIITLTSGLTTPFAPSRSVIRMLAQPQAVTMDLGPSLTTPSVQSLSGIGYARARAQYLIQDAYSRTWIATFEQGAQSGNRGATVQMTEAYRGGAVGTVDLDIPEFDGIAGWMPTWGLRPGEQTTWTFSGVGWTTPGGVLQAPSTDGAEYRSASVAGQFTP